MVNVGEPELLLVCEGFMMLSWWAHSESNPEPTDSLWFTVQAFLFILTHLPAFPLLPAFPAVPAVPVFPPLLLSVTAWQVWDMRNHNDPRSLSVPVAWRTDIDHWIVYLKAA